MLLFLFLGCCFGGALFDEAEAELEMIRETTADGVVSMWQNVTQLVSGGYFNAALLHNGTVVVRGMGVSTSWDGPFSHLVAGTYTLALVPVASSSPPLVFDFRAPNVEPSPSHVAPSSHPSFCIGHDTFSAYAPPQSQHLCCGSTFALSLQSDGSIVGIGNSSFGALGHHRHLPQWTQIHPTMTSSMLACGGDFALSVRNDGSVVAWGWSGMGQMGAGDVPLPERMQQPTMVKWEEKQNVKNLWAGGYGHAGIVTQEGRVWGWGWSLHGQLGDITGQERQMRPQLIVGLENIGQVASGSFKHTAALTQDGRVVAIGSNQLCQITPCPEQNVE